MERELHGKQQQQQQSQSQQQQQQHTHHLLLSQYPVSQDLCPTSPLQNVMNLDIVTQQQQQQQQQPSGNVF